MNELDYVLIMIILSCAVIGLRRGFVRTLLSTAGVYFIVIVVGYAYAPMGRTMSGAFNLGRTMMDNFAYIVLLAAMTVVVELASRATFEETRIYSLQQLDNVLGGIVGLMHGAFWASLFLAPVQYGISQTRGSWMEAVCQSQLVPHLNSFFQTAVLDVVSILFADGIPSLFLNQISGRVSQLLPNLALLRLFASL